MCVEENHCPLCGASCPNVPGTLSHLRTIHSSDPLFNVTCGLGGCANTSRSFRALYSHIYRNHPGIIQRRSDSKKSLSNLELSNLEDLIPVNYEDNEDDTNIGK